MENNLYEKATQKLAELTKFFTEKITPVTVEAFKSIKLKDSDQEVEISELKKGADVSVSSATGSVSAPDQKWVLVNGSIFTTKNGKIDSIEKEADEPVEDPKEEDKAPAKLADEPVAEPATEDAPADDTDARITALEAEVAQLKEAMGAVLEVIQGQPTKEDVNSFNSKAKDIDTKIELLSKIPTQLSADNRLEIKESEIEKFTRIAESYSKNK